MLSFVLFVVHELVVAVESSLFPPIQTVHDHNDHPEVLYFCVSDLSFVASQYLDRYLVTLFLGIKAAGIYFLFWTVANAASTFLTLVVQQQQRPLLIHAYRVGGSVRALSARLAFHADNGLGHRGAQHCGRFCFPNSSCRGWVSPHLLTICLRSG